MTDTNQPRKRSRLRRLTSFSLRTALIATTVLAVWLGLHMNSVRKQRASVAAVLRHGGEVSYDYQQPIQIKAGRLIPAESPVPKWLLRMFGQDHFHDVVSVIARERDDHSKKLADLEVRRDHERIASDDFFGQLGEFPKLEILLLHSSVANERGLRYAGQHENLRKLHIFRPVELTEQGLAHLAKAGKLDGIVIMHAQLDSLRGLDRVPNLRQLYIYNSEFTGDSLQHLQTLTQLRELRLVSNGTSLADGDLFYLSHLTQLEDLAVDDPNITEDNLRHLTGLENLRSLSLARISLSADGLSLLAGMKNLRSLSLPETSISADGLSHIAALENLRSLTVKPSGVKKLTWLQQQLPNCKVGFSY